MLVAYKRMWWLAHIARSPGTAQTVTQAWCALHEFCKPGWRCLRGCWQWAMPRTGMAVHLVHVSKEYVEHLFRKWLRENQLVALEKRRPCTFGGMGARLNREVTLSKPAVCATHPDNSLLRGALVGAVCTADTAHGRGLHPNDCCPYYTKGIQEGEDHLPWWCDAWKAAKEPFLVDVMLLARALKLWAPSEWIPCLHLLGLLPESVVAHSGLTWGPGLKNECKELHRVSQHRVLGPGEDWEEACRQRAELALAGQQWEHDDNNPLEQFVHKPHGMFVVVLQTRMRKEEEAGLLFPIGKRRVQHDCYSLHQLQLPCQRPQLTEVPMMGALPRDWRWGNDFLPAMLCWLRELQWLQLYDDLVVGHMQVWFMELAVDFESHAGRPLPPTPQSQFTGPEMSLQEKGRVV